MLVREWSRSPAELSALLVAARATDHGTQDRREAPGAASFAGVQRVGPVGGIALAGRTDEDLRTRHDAPGPRRAPLVRIEGGTAAEAAGRTVDRRRRSV